MLEVIIPENSPQTPHRYRIWRRSGDTLVIMLTNGFYGVHARVLPRGRDWVGAVRTTSDNIGTLLYERTLTLRTVDCNSPPPAADGEIRLPRAVELMGDLTVTLGSAVPEDVRLAPRRSGAFTVQAEAAGRFAGADTIVIVLDETSRLVGRIELRYRHDFDVSGIVADIEAEAGPPRFASWQNRTTRLSVFPPGVAGWRVILIDPRFGR
jgi:hypothetical protein